MKTFIIAMFLLISFSTASAQKRFDTPGDNLRYAAKQNQIGNFMFTCAIGAHMLWLKNGNQYGEGLKYVAPGIALVGLVLKVSAANYQTRAGFQLNQQTTLTITDDGVGLVLKL
jgi:hypothetical protein